MSSHNMLFVVFREKAVLRAVYMPFINYGGLFIPHADQYSLGDEVFMLLQLMDDPERLAVAAKAVWITPAGAQSSRVEGTGFQFLEQDGRARSRIEACLGALLESEQAGCTL